LYYFWTTYILSKFLSDFYFRVYFTTLLPDYVLSNFGIIIIIILGSEWNVMWKNYFDLAVNCYNVPAASWRGSGKPIESTSSMALWPPQQSQKHYRLSSISWLITHLNLQSMTSFMKKLMKERTREYSNTVYFFLSYFFKARFNIIFQSVPRRVTTSLKGFR